MYAQSFPSCRVGARREAVNVDATLAEDSATVVLGHPLNPNIKFSGRSWKSRKDDPDPDVGYYLALGRALEAMGRDLQRQAWRRVHDKESK